MQNLITVAGSLFLISYFIMHIKLSNDLEKIREEMQRLEKAIRDNDCFLREMQYRAQMAQNKSK